MHFIMTADKGVKIMHMNRTIKSVSRCIVDFIKRTYSENRGCFTQDYALNSTFSMKCTKCCIFVYIFSSACVCVKWHKMNYFWANLLNWAKNQFSNSWVRLNGSFADMHKYTNENWRWWHIYNAIINYLKSVSRMNKQKNGRKLRIFSMWTWTRRKMFGKSHFYTFE